MQIVAKYGAAEQLCHIAATDDTYAARMQTDG